MSRAASCGMALGKATMRPTGARLAAVLAFCALNALVFSASAPEAHATPDSAEYLRTGFEFLDGHLRTLDWRLPGYGVFLAPFLNSGGVNLPALVAAQTLLALGGALLAQQTYDQLVGKRGIAVLLLSLFGIGTVTACQTIMTEALFSCVITAHCYFTIRFLQAGGLWRVLAGSLLAVAATLIKANGLAFFLVSLAVCMAVSLWRKDFLGMLRASLVGLVTFALPIALFLAYKHDVTGSASLLPERYARYAAVEYVVGLEGKLAGFPIPPVEELRKRAHESGRKALGASPEQWAKLNEEEKMLRMQQQLPAIVLSYGPAKLAKALLVSSYFLFSEDPGALTNMVALPDIKLSAAPAAIFAASGGNRLAAAGVAALKVLAYLYIFFRLVAYAASAAHFLRGPVSSAELLIAMQLLALIAIVNVMGSPRFRMPLDPMLYVFICHRAHLALDSGHISRFFHRRGI